MAKSITYFDREHTGGINLAAMEDTQLKENLVQDVATGGDEAPTATAVKEAVDAKMDKADIVNDLTTGGTDKALSAEQGKVLEDKKVDKLTEANDLVYVHGSDGTESGKALSEFVVDTDIVNDRASGGADKVLAAEIGKDTCFIFNIDVPLASAGGKTVATVNNAKLTDMALSPANVYIHPDEIPEDVKQKIRKNDLVVFSSLFWGFARFSRLGLASDTKVNSTTNAVINTSLPDTGNWEGWYMFDMLNYGTDRVKVSSKTKFIELDSASMPNTLATLADVKEDGIFKKWIYVDTAELGTAKDGDIVQLTVAGKNYFGILGGPQVGTGATIDDEMLNTTLPASGNWQGWSRIYITNSIDNVSVVNGKVNTHVVTLHDCETLDTIPATTDAPLPGGYSLSILYLREQDLLNKDESPMTNKIKNGDIIVLVSSKNASKRLYTCIGIVTGLATEADPLLTPGVLNTSLPPSGNWNGYLILHLLSTGFDRIAMLNKADSTKMQNYLVTWNKKGETWKTLPDYSTYNSNKGVSSATLYVHPDDLGEVKNTIKRGDIVTFAGTSDSDSKVVGHIEAMYKDIMAASTLPDTLFNVGITDASLFKGWYRFMVMSSIYDNKQMANKRSQYVSTVMISDEETPETAATLAGCDVTSTSNKALCYVYIKPEELGITDYSVGDNVIVNISSTLAKQQITIEGWLGSKVTSGSTLLDGIMLNTKLPASGNWNGFCRLNITNILTNPAVINAKSRNWTITVKATDTQFQETWKASKTGAIEDKACPQINFMLTKDMMSQIPNAKVGDTIYLYAGMAETKLPYNLYLYGKLHALRGIPSTESPSYYQIQDNTGDMTGCGTMQLISGNIVSGMMQRKPNFWQMTSTAENSNIPSGLESFTSIAFAPGKDTAKIADALKNGDLIEVKNSSEVMYMLMFTRYATSADNAKNKGLIVGQTTEPEDMTGYLFCRIISSTYDRKKITVFETSRYQPTQFELGKLYSMNIKPSNTSDRINLNGLGIDEGNIAEYDCVLRRGFVAGTVFRLLSNNTNVILQVVANTYNQNNKITAVCLAKGTNSVVEL